VLLDFVDLPEDDPARERRFSEHLACPTTTRWRSRTSSPGSSPSTRRTAPARVHRPRHQEGGRPELIIPDEERSLARARSSRGPAAPHGVLPAPARGAGEAEKFSVDTPWRQLPARAQKTILYGSEDQVHVRYRNKYGRERSYYTGFEGVVQWIERRHNDTESDWSRDKYEGYMRDVPCPVCGGARLKPEVLAVTIAGKSIAEVCNLSSGTAPSCWPPSSSTTGRR
jgi:excinuclease ABC subunit A